MLTTVKLHGFLGKKYGKTFKFAVKTPAEAIRLFKANFKTFEKDLINHQPGFRIIVGEETLDAAEKILYPSGRQCIRIVPVVKGSGAVGRMIAGALLIYFAGPIAGTIGMGLTAGGVVGMGFSLILGGVIELLTPTTSTKSSSSEAAKNTPSYIFNGAVNTTQQGNPIPILYGEMLVGSQTISAGLSVSQLT